MEVVTLFERLRHRIGRKRSEHDLDPETFDPPRDERVPVEALLCGAQAGRPLERWVEETGEESRASLRLVDSPYVSFLRSVRARPAGLDDDAFLRDTDYYRMAKRCAEHVGKWFGAREDAGILERVRTFGHMLPELSGDAGPELRSLGGEGLQGRSTRGEPLQVFAVRDSRCRELQDGHHRAALAVMAGHDAVDARVLGSKWSYLQRLVLQGVQTRGRKEMYQPLPAPEMDGDWKLVRRCSDRFAMMRRFLEERGIAGDGRRSLDLASSYGWFVSAFRDLGFSAHGVERDEVAVRVGRVGYRLAPDSVRVMSLERFLRGNEERFDVVLFLSILHHFVIGRESGAATELIRLVDRACSGVLFFDTGEEHEGWMAGKLPGWNADFVERWLRENTTFDEIVRLGTDEDVVTFPGNYGRTLFACIRVRNGSDSSRRDGRHRPS